MGKNKIELQDVIDIIKQKKQMKPSEIATDLEVSCRTLRRHLELLKDYGYKVKYSRKQGRYIIEGFDN